MSHPSRTAAATLVLIAGLAAAQGPTQQIEVRGHAPVRTDVQTLCPDIAGELNDALAKTVQEFAAAAVVDVRFELTGNRVGEVHTGAGPARYQRLLKRAVRDLQCDSGNAAPQTVALRVRFVDPFDRSQRTAAAGVVLLGASAAAR
ncbi:MAG TPA: hypothetical protein VFQ20_09335 [Burkholderiaceae bacterium]|nr:hypothetical protein [Burkholderiaceae bacterium]